ncbi:hypothetical protein RHMOL_Rhmol11G0069400 [Rhododendron molle]|uniref:Uncharacterized protein n=1 Tax=Rhododendron molle TaxID=49168 RepID=A0ACC0LQG1_RHOML|nr:hypothetical protein RHMOL_Rhmol11G0069400 [Rhododendron molle]
MKSSRYGKDQVPGIASEPISVQSQRLASNGTEDLVFLLPTGPSSVRLVGRGNCSELMVVHAPFVRWDLTRNGFDACTKGGIYYLETAQGVIRGERNHMAYRHFYSLLQDYHVILPLSTALEWNFRGQLAAWVDGIVYHSFLRYSEEAMPILLEFELRLKQTFHIFDLEEMVIKMAHRTWNMPEVYFYAIDTNAQALLQSAAKKPLQIGELLTHALALSAGSGGNPLLGEEATEESKEAITAFLGGSDLVFITTGIGGGTGSGFAPVVAQISREADYLSVGVVTYRSALKDVKDPSRQVPIWLCSLQLASTHPLSHGRGVAVRPSRGIRDEFGSFIWAVSFTASLSRLPLRSVSVYSLSVAPINDRCIAPPHAFSTPSTASPSVGFARLGLAWICGYGCCFVVPGLGLAQLRLSSFGFSIICWCLAQQLSYQRLLFPKWEEEIYGLPAVIGGSYTFVAATISIILSGRFNDPNPIEGFKQTMQAIQGALIVASTLQIVLRFSGLWRNVTRFLSPLTPLSAVPLVALAGFGLYEFGFPGVGERKPAYNTFVTGIRIIDQSLQPTIISMWDHFSEYEAPTMASLKGTYPVAVGLRLKTSTYYGTTLATQRTSGFILNPLTAEATTLQSWCIANSNKIKHLPSMAAMKPLMLASATSSSSDPVKIINLPTLVEKIELDSELIFWKPSVRKMFVDNCKSLRIMKSSDAIDLGQPNADRVHIITFSRRQNHNRTAFDVSLTDDSWTKDTFEIVSGNTSMSWERLDAYEFLVLLIVSLVQFMKVRWAIGADGPSMLLRGVRAEVCWITNQKPSERDEWYTVWNIRCWAEEYRSYTLLLASLTAYNLRFWCLHRHSLTMNVLEELRY